MMNTRRFAMKGLLTAVLIVFAAVGCQETSTESTGQGRASMGQGWTSYVVEGGRQVGYYCVVKAHSDGTAHAAYLDRANENLKYACRGHNGFTTQTAAVGDNLGQCASIVVDAKGAVHVSFYDRMGLGIKYTVLDKGKWNAEIVESNNVGPQSSMVVDDTVRTAYFDRGREDLKYATKTDEGWRIVTLDATGATGYQPSMVIMPSGKKSIAYYDKTDEAIFLIDPDDSAVRKVASAKPGGERLCLCVDKAGRRAVSYHDPESNGLMVALESGDKFVASRVANGGKWSSLVAEDNGRLHLSYSDPANNGSLGYGLYDEGSWHLETVDSGPEAGQFNDICLLPDGRPLICYFDRAKARLLCAIRAP